MDERPWPLHDQNSNNPVTIILLYIGLIIVSIELRRTSLFYFNNYHFDLPIGIERFKIFSPSPYLTNPVDTTSLIIHQSLFTTIKKNSSNIWAICLCCKFQVNCGNSAGPRELKSISKLKFEPRLVKESMYLIAFTCCN